MPDYLERLEPNATMGDVFYDLYGQANALVRELDVQRVAEYGEKSSMKPIPGTGLQMNWGAGRDISSEIHSTTYLQADTWDGHSLLATSTHSPAVTPSVQNPAGVAAWRGFEIGGDYSLTQEVKHRRSVIGVRLAGLGVKGPLSDEEEPLTGFFFDGSDERVKDLHDTQRSRLAIVTRGILDGIAMVELIRDGSPVGEVLSMMGRELKRS